MNLRLNKFKLRFATSAVSVVALAAIGFNVVLPVVTSPSPAGRIQAPATAPAVAQSDADQLDFSQLLDVSLRRPLVDMPTAASRPAVAVGESPLGLRLIGTIMEPMHSYAVFSDAAGKTDLKSVGDRAGAAQISAITMDSVTLQVFGRPMVLHTLKPPANPGGFGP